jgi:hypothetical protein
MSTANIFQQLTGHQAKSSEASGDLFDTLVRDWGLPVKSSKVGPLGDLSAAREMARDPEAVKEAYGTENPFLAASLAGEEYERGQDSAVDNVLERAAEPDSERAAIDSNVVQSATPIEVDPEIVSILSDAAPMLDLVQMEAQPGFTAQYNVIDDRNAPVGRVSESTAIDLTSASDGDFSLATETEEMKIYVDRVTLSDFTQRAEDSLNYMNVEETTLGERTAVYGKYVAGELLYGDPTVGSSGNAGVDAGSIQDSTASPGLARIAQDADSGSIGAADNVVSKTSTTSDFLEDIKSEITSLVTDTGASYDDLVAVTSPSFFDAIENEQNTVVRLDGFDEDLNFGGRQITLKQNVPLEEVRAVGRSDHGGYTYDGTGGAGNFDPDPGDVFIFDQSAYRHRQLAPLSTVPLGRRGLADEAAMFAYSANIDKSLGAHVKYLQGYDF